MKLHYAALRSRDTKSGLSRSALMVIVQTGQKAEGRRQLLNPQPTPPIPPSPRLPIIRFVATLNENGISRAVNHFPVYGESSRLGWEPLLK